MQDQPKRKGGAAWTVRLISLLAAMVLLAGTASAAYGDTVQEDDRDLGLGLDDFADARAICYLDEDGDGTHEAGEPLYATGGCGDVSSLDLRLSESLGGDPGTQVDAGDSDAGQPLSDPAGARVGFFDTDGSSGYSAGDTVYVDVDGSGEVTSGDLRITPTASQAAGTFVAAGDGDLNNGLGADRDLATPSWRFYDADGTDDWSSQDTAYVDADGSNDVSSDDIRLGPTPDLQPETDPGPSISIAVPATGQTFEVDEAIEIRGSAEAGEQEIADVEVRVDGEELDVTGTETWSATWNPGQEGTYRVVATVTDTGGVTDQASVEVQVEASTPGDWVFHAETSIAPVPPLVVEPGDQTLVLVAMEAAEDDGGFVAALDASDGSVVWEADLGSILGWVAGSEEDLVYASVEDEGIVAFQAAGGDTRWATRMVPTTPPALGSSGIYVGAGDRLAALDPAGDGVRWDTGITGGEVTQRPSVANGMVFAVADDPDAGTGAVQALGAERGEVRWSHGVEGIDRTDRLQSPVPANGLLYVAGHGERTLAALDPGSGAVLWRVITEAPFSARTSVAGCTLVNAWVTGVVTVLNATNGEERWGVKRFGEIEQRPIIAGGGMYYVNEAGDLFGVDLLDRKQTVVQRLETHPVARPVASGTLLLQVTENSLYAFQTEPRTPAEGSAEDAYGSCPDAGDLARGRAQGFGADITREPEGEGEFPEHGPGDDQPLGPPASGPRLVNVSPDARSASADDARESSRETPFASVLSLLGAGLVAAAVRRHR